MARVFLQLIFEMFLLVPLVVAGLVWYFMEPEERRRVWRVVTDLPRKAAFIATMGRPNGDAAFHAALRARVRWPLITYVLVAANLAVFAWMVLGPAALNDPATLVAWGGNVGPRTTGGERWRVLTSVFVHRGILHLLVNVAVLVQLGLVLERVVGPFTFGTIFIASGVFGSIVSAAASPMRVFVGADGAVFGLYGVLLAVIVRGLLQPAFIRIPFAVLQTIVPVTAVCAFYYWATGEPSVTLKAGLCAGLVGGIALTRSMSDGGARLRRYATLGAATAAIVMMSALSLRAVTDVRPEIAAVVANEERTAAAYDAAVVQFRKGRTTTRELARVIEQTILPTLQRARVHLAAITDVPAADAPLVAHADEYLRLRKESWRIRADALRKGTMRNLREADAAEQASLQAFARLKSAVLH